MVEKRRPISVQQAIARVMAHVRPLEKETVHLLSSYGRVLAEDIVATHDVPPFNRAPYDGYAIRSADSIDACRSHRVEFHVIEQIGAGEIAKQALYPGQAVRIMTGAAMPEGADAVVMLEQTKLSAVGDTFTIHRPFEALENVSLQGEDAKRGEHLIERGHHIHPGTVALLATFGYSEVEVAKRPSVGLIATGSELLDVEEKLVPGKIRNSNGPMIAAQLARIGVSSHVYGTFADDLESCLQQVIRALDESDCVITTGGVSVGDFDYLPAIYERLGAEVLFNKVSMRPGSVTTVAVWNGKYLFGLSGNPSACYTGFELFTRPALLGMMGSRQPYLRYTQAVLAEDFPKMNPFMRFVRSIYEFDGTQATIRPAGFNKSNAVSSIAKGNALMVLPGGTKGYACGEQVDVLLLGTETGDETWRI